MAMVWSRHKRSIITGKSLLLHKVQGLKNYAGSCVLSSKLMRKDDAHFCNIRSENGPAFGGSGAQFLSRGVKQIKKGRLP